MTWSYPRQDFIAITSASFFQTADGACSKPPAGAYLQWMMHSDLPMCQHDLHDDDAAAVANSN